MKKWLLPISAVMLSGCATSTITAFKDPAFSDAHYSTVVVAATGMTLAATVEVERQLCKKLTPTICFRGSSLLPPTRNYTKAEVSDALTKNSIEAALIVSLKGDKANSQYLSTINNSTANAYVNTTGGANYYGNNALYNSQSYGSASEQTTSTPIYGFSRVAFGELTLVDEKSGKIAWSGEIRIEGQGTANVTDSAFIDSAATKISNELKASLLID